LIGGRTREQLNGEPQKPITTVYSATYQSKTITRNNFHRLRIFLTDNEKQTTKQQEEHATVTIRHMDKYLTHIIYNIVTI
jgi:hypothetical protein